MSSTFFVNPDMTYRHKDEQDEAKDPTRMTDFRPGKSLHRLLRTLQWPKITIWINDVWVRLTQFFKIILYRFVID